MWVKGKQNIPKKYLPILEELFTIDKEIFSKEVTEIDKLEIQKEKLKRDLKPIITKHEKRYNPDKINEIVNVPVYDKDEINKLEREIEKVKLISKFRESMDIAELDPYMDTFKLMVELLSKAQQEPILHKTVEALAHYLEVLPDKVSSNEENREFETEIFEVFDDNNF